MHTFAMLAAAVSGLAGNAAAQQVPATLVQAGVTLPANTEVPVALSEQLNSKRARKGNRFDVTVTRDVMAGTTVAIPRGTRGVGEVVWRTGRGAYGKSGKMEIALRSLDVNGRTVSIGGRFREEGEGNTLATVGVVLAAGLLPGAFVTGHSAVIEAGREFHGYTQEVATFDAVRPATPRIAVAAAAAPQVVFAAIAPVPVVPSAAPALTGYERQLAAQRGVHGREPRQGWSISE